MTTNSDLSSLLGQSGIPSLPRITTNPQNRINPNMAPPKNFWDGDKFNIGVPGMQATEPRQAPPVTPSDPMPTGPFPVINGGISGSAGGFGTYANLGGGAPSNWWSGLGGNSQMLGRQINSMENGGMAGSNLARATARNPFMNSLAIY